MNLPQRILSVTSAGQIAKKKDLIRSLIVALSVTFLTATSIPFRALAFDQGAITHEGSIRYQWFLHFSSWPTTMLDLLTGLPVGQFDHYDARGADFWYTLAVFIGINTFGWFILIWSAVKLVKFFKYRKEIVLPR